MKNNSKIKDLWDKLFKKLLSLSQNKVLNIMKDGFMTITPIIIIGSLFLLLSTLGQSFNGAKPLVPALADWTPKFALMSGLTMNFTSAYLSISTAIAYANMYKLDRNSSAMIGLITFLLININEIVDKTISVKAFAAESMFVTIIVVFVAMWVYRQCIEHKVTIKMPDSVPPAVGNAFASLIPMIIVSVSAWTIRTVANIDLTKMFNTFLTPIINAGDNIFAFTLYKAANNFLWSLGIHGTGMLGGIFKPLETQWLLENAEAFQAGVPIPDLPHVWTTPLNRMITWTSSAWGLIFWLAISKVKRFKIVAAASAPSAVFSIAEPLIFSLPVMLNPYLMIPCIISPALAGAVAYLATMLKLVNPTFIDVPWMTPPPIIGFISTGGDWRGVVIVFIAFFIGILCYWPFFKAFEREELKLEEEAENTAKTTTEA